MPPVSPHPGPNATRQQVAQWMASHATAAGLPAELPVMAGLVESNLRNLNYGDADSLGYFQMRSSIWNQGPYQGYANNPDLQMQWFIDQAKKASRGGSLGDWVANIERPAEQYRGRYALREKEARALLAGMPGAGTAAGMAAPTPTPLPAESAGPVAPAPTVDPRVGQVQSLINQNAKLAGISGIRIPENVRLRVEVEQPKAQPGQPRGARQMAAPPPSPDQIGQALVAGAKQFLGVKYVWGGESLKEGGFDCSGLMQTVYRQMGIDVPRVSQAQFQSGTPIDPAQAQAGDMVFFQSSGSSTAPGHVGMALGDGRFIHAPRTGDVIKISSLADRSDLVGVRRYR